MATAQSRRRLMKTYRNLYPQIHAFSNLYCAYLKARRGKRYRPEVLQFTARLEENLLHLRRELVAHTYRTGPYRRFIVYEPKRRRVAALPFRDRIVQHALCNVIEPIWEPRFIYHSYACRAGKGTHAGADQVTRYLRQVRRNHDQAYVLKADIHRYFPSVDHQVLLSILQHHIRCSHTIDLITEILASGDKTGRGIPIGNLTSQLFANIYLNHLDQFVKRHLHIPHYVRYMDDFIVVHHDKPTLWSWRYEITNFLKNTLCLELNPKTAVFPEARGVDFLGYRIWRTHRLLRKRSIRQMRRKFKAFQRGYVTGEIPLDHIGASIASWVGHAKHANTYNLRRKMFAQFTL